MKTIFVGASSYNTIDESYFKLSEEVALLCIKKQYKLVFGARNEGMMGRLYKTYMDNHIEIEAITIKEYLSDLENVKCDTKIFETTKEQIDYFLKCDILLFLPGGLGSLNEFISSVVSKRNNETKAKIILYNYNNYYKEILDLINKFENLGFSKKDNLFVVVSSLEELEKELD